MFKAVDIFFPSSVPVPKSLDRIDFRESILEKVLSLKICEHDPLDLLKAKGLCELSRVLAMLCVSAMASGS